MQHICLGQRWQDQLQELVHLFANYFSTGVQKKFYGKKKILSVMTQSSDYLFMNWEYFAGFFIQKGEWRARERVRLHNAEVFAEAISVSMLASMCENPSLIL